MKQRWDEYKVKGEEELLYLLFKLKKGEDLYMFELIFYYVFKLFVVGVLIDDYNFYLLDL